MIPSRSPGHGTHTFALRRPSLSQRLGTVLIAARLIGIEHDERTLAWCPACGTESGRRGAKLRRDGTSRVGVAPSGLGWRCYSCSAGGGSADLVAFARFRCPMSELSRDELRALGEHVDALTGDAPAGPARPAPADGPPSAAERDARAKDAEARRWARVCTDAADYVRELLARTNTTSEREAWDAFERFEPPPAVPETGAIVWRGERIPWGELQAAWLSSFPGRQTHRAGVNRRTDETHGHEDESARGSDERRAATAAERAG